MVPRRLGYTSVARWFVCQNLCEFSLGRFVYTGIQILFAESHISHLNVVKAETSNFFRIAVADIYNVEYVSGLLTAFYKFAE